MDNHHVRISSLQCSCGGLELSQLSEDPKKILYALGTYLYHPARGSPAAFIIWSDLSEKGSRGSVLCDFVCSALPEGDFGLIWSSKRMENPKTSNVITVWFWEIPHELFKKWWLNERVERAKRV